MFNDIIQDGDTRVEYAFARLKRGEEDEVQMLPRNRYERRHGRVE